MYPLFPTMLQPVASYLLKPLCRGHSIMACATGCVVFSGQPSHTERIEGGLGEGSRRGSGGSVRSPGCGPSTSDRLLPRRISSVLTADQKEERRR